ncbi:MAG: SCO family protein [Fidelibacterota bacterium]
MLRLLVLVLLSLLSAQALTDNDPQLNKIDIVEHLGDTIPLDLPFITSHGDTVLLRSLFIPDTPVILTLAYYECPMLCTFVLNGLGAGLTGIPFQSGTDYKLITISIDPGETADLAATKEAVYTKEYKQMNWSFLVGDSIDIKRLAEAVGFQYYYDRNSDEFAHPAAVFILTPDGVISRYLYGLNYSGNDLRLGLLEASKGRIGTTIDRILLYCYHYDPEAGSYVLFATNVMRLGGVLTVIFMVIFFSIMWTMEKRKTAETLVKQEKH